MGKLRSFIFVFLIALGITAVAKEYKYQAVKGDPMNTRIYTLDNGLKVYLSVNKEKPRIQTYIAVRTGSRNDPAETTGLAHYLEHLMFKGTKQFGTTDAAKEAPYLKEIEDLYEVYRTQKAPAERKATYHKIDSISQIAAKYFIPNEYDKLMSSIGAQGTNAYTSNDVTCYTEDIPSNEVENWAKIQADRFQNMVIRGFHTELEAVYEEYNMGLTRDFNKAIDALNKHLFPGHPYGTQTTIGTQEHLKNPSIVNIKNYFKRYYVPNNVAICMSGDLDPDAVMAIIEKYFGTWKPSTNLTFPTYAPVKDLAAHVDTTIVGQEAPAVMLGFKFDKAASLQADTLALVSEMLSNYRAGLFDLNLKQALKCQEAVALTQFDNEYSELVCYGMPKEGQSLKEVKDLMLGQIEKLKNGDFDPDLLPSVINNMKVSYYQALESNDARADMYVDAFIDGKKWEDVVGRIDRISKITKEQVMDFARRHFLDNYVAVYKELGNDATQKKIEKPQITAIPTNRELQSKFVGDIINSKVEPIQPRFVNFDKDMSKAKTRNKQTVLYVPNTTNGLFNFTIRYEFGEESDKWLPYAVSYFDYLGTDKMTPEQVKQKFYKLGCDFTIGAGKYGTTLNLSGLNENMPQALALMNDVLTNVKVDKAAYKRFVDASLKTRRDAKLDQGSCYSALRNYGIYGKYNTYRNVPDSAELVNKDPQALVDMIKGLKNYEYKVLYYGPAPLKDFVKTVDKGFKAAKKLMPVPAGKEYMEQPTPTNEILIAPYKAKNIYLAQYNNSGRQWMPEHEPLATLFNEYFGGGMNSVVFQEMRESRGLAYSAYGYYGTPGRPNHPEFAQTYIITQNDKMMDCIRTFNAIIDTIPQSEKAFDLAKQATLKRLASQRTVKMGIIDLYLFYQRFGLNYDLNEAVYKAIPSITLNDLVKFENEVMANKPYRYMILGDENDIDMKALEKIAPVKKLTLEEVFGY